MINWKNESLLEIVEALAEWESMISSEEELSDKFDEYINAINESSECPCACDYSDDEVAVNEDFVNWVDNLTKDGELHPLQYENYSYVGEHS